MHEDITCLKNGYDMILVPMPELPVVPRPAVVVLGAGLAGLAAAYELRKKGIDVVVLEAQMRPGGRILTLRGFADGMYAEAGAMSVPDSETTAVSYIAELNLPIQSKRPPNPFHRYFLEGRLIADNDKNAHWPDLIPAEQKLGPDGLFAKYIAPILSKVGDPDSPGWPPPELRELDSISIADYVARQGASPGAVRLLGMGLFDEDGEGYQQTSALFAVAWLSKIISAKSVYTLVGGMEQLPLAFAKRLEKRILYGCPVTRIEHHPDRVSIQYRKFDGEIHTLEADYAICTIPFAVLRGIPFHPPLPSIKQKMFNELDNTSVLRTYIQTRTRFWAEPNFTGQVYTELPIENLYSAYDGPGVRGILESYTTSVKARRFGAEDTAIEIQEMLQGMSEIYPQLLDQAEGGVRWDWDADPWSKGAYIDYAPGQFLQFYPYVRQPDGRIHYAGDHTSLVPGWMEGALSTGARAAADVEQLLTQNKKEATHGN